MSGNQQSRAIRSGASPVFDDQEVIDMADKLLELASDPDSTRYDALLADADAQSAALAAMGEDTTLQELADLATPLIEHFPGLVEEWTSAKRITLVTGACRLRRYATNDKDEFRRFVLSVRNRTNEHDPNVAVHW